MGQAQSVQSMLLITLGVIPLLTTECDQNGDQCHHSEESEKEGTLPSEGFAGMPDLRIFEAEFNAMRGTLHEDGMAARLMTCMTPLSQTPKQSKWLKSVKIGQKRVFPQ
eukprot:6490273-Amphidinium_carterae.2